MSDPVIERVPQAVKAALEGITTIDDLVVYRNRHAPVQVFPALIVLEGDQLPVDEETGVQRYDIGLTVQGFVKVAGDEDPGPPLNRLYATVVRALKAALDDDDTLGGVAVNLTEGELRRLIDPEGDSERQAQFDLDIIVQIMTAESDPFSPAP